jgi:hypothetical protein
MYLNNNVPRDLRSSGMLRSVDWQVVTDVSGQHRSHLQEFFLDCLTFEDGADRLSRNVGN